MPSISELIETTRPIRDRLVDHPVYTSMTTPEALRVFMEHHVFAVWDFMSLLKFLQRELTCVELPWKPSPFPVSRRLINEIVLGEESDATPDGSYASHFELYRQAMRECGADTTAIDDFLSRLNAGGPIDKTLTSSGAPGRSGDFVRSTWAAIESGKPHVVAASFTFGREDLIPGMFRQLVSRWNFPTFNYYLERHIDLDENTHAPMAIRMIEELCGDDPVKWREATSAVKSALQARIALWNGIACELRMIESPTLQCSK